MILSIAFYTILRQVNILDLRIFGVRDTQSQNPLYERLNSFY